MYLESIPVAARSKTQVCGLSPAEIVGSNPTGERMFVCFECCVLSGRGLCEELITRPEESYRLWCVVVCDLETTKHLVNQEEAKADQRAMAPREKICSWKEKERENFCNLLNSIPSLRSLWRLFQLCCKKFRLQFGLTNVLHPYTRRKYQHVSSNNKFVTDVLNALYIPDV